ncbi:MAG: glycosyltransferase, partial [Rhodospirillales bacterium]
MDGISKSPVVYRIAHRFNYASVNLVNALARFCGCESYHFLTHPFSSFVPERGFFAMPPEFSHDEISVDDLREINRRLIMARIGRDKTEDAFAEHWKFGRPSPDLLVINQGSGISPEIKTLFSPSPRTLFYAECYRINDFYPRAEWPMPESMREMDENYEKRAIAYGENCDAVIVPSDYARTLWPEHLRHKVHAVFEGFDTNFLAPERIHRLSRYGSLIKRRFKGKRLVAYIGETIEPIRGFDRWMETCLALRERYDDLHFIVVSNDRIKYGDIGKTEFHGMTSFKDWTLKKLGLDETRMPDFSWLGVLPLYDYLSLLSALDLVIYPMYGMFANWSLFHALHMGAPVVAADRAYLPEVIADGKNGFLADPDDTAMLVEKSAAVLDNPDLRQSFAIAGRATIENRFSLVQTAEKLSALLQGSGLSLERPSAIARGLPEKPAPREIAFYAAFENADVGLAASLLETVRGLAPAPPDLFIADKSQNGIPPELLKAYPNTYCRRFPANTAKAVALNIMMQTYPARLAIKLEPGADLPGPDWLEGLLAAFNDNPRLAGGQLLPIGDDEVDENALGL